MRKLNTGEKEFLGIFDNRICLYCGEKMKSKWEDYEKYFECDCEDAKKEREIRLKIQKLERELPRPNYSIEQTRVIKRITDWTPEQMMVRMTPEQIKKLNENTERLIELSKGLHKRKKSKKEEDRFA